ncbi:NACHT domain-containing protein, partial [Planctomycetota bacterium]
SMETGGGKTTILRYLQTEIFKDKRRIPLYIHASKLEKWDYTCVNSFLNCLAIWIGPQVAKPKEILFEYLKETFEKKILLLVDGLDQIGGVDTEYKRVLEGLLRVCSDNLIVASRPTAVVGQETNPEVKFLRLKSFSENSQKEYFDEYYERAYKLCESDLNLLAVPMLAYMVRTLIEENEDKKIENRASLYKRFIKYILCRSEHGAPELTLDERLTVRKYLQEVSYYAMKDSMIQTIPAEFCWNSIQKYKALELDTLPKYGLVNLIIDKSGENVCFTHQSFQEYLAAEWISQDEEKVDNVLKEYWNPKWQEVIKFLSGHSHLGRQVVTKLRPKEGCYDPIYARLFLTAECACELPDGNDIKNELIDDLIRGPLHNQPEVYCWSQSKDRLTTNIHVKSSGESLSFPSEAMTRLFELAYSQSEDMAWRIVSQNVTEGSCLSLAKLKLIRSLYSEERFSWACERLRDSVKRFGDINPAAFTPKSVRKRFAPATNSICALFIEWLFQLPDSFIDDLASRMFDIHYHPLLDHYEFIRALPTRLDEPFLRRVINALPGDSALVKARLFAIVECVGPRLEETDISRLIELFGSRSTDIHWTNEFGQVLEDIAENFGKASIEQILQVWFEKGGLVKAAISSFARKFNSSFTEKQVRQIVDCLYDHSSRVRLRALSLLEGLRLEETAVDRIFDMFTDEFASGVALHTSMSMWPYLDAKRKEKILNLVRCGNQTALAYIHYIKEELVKKDIIAIVENFRQSPSRQGAEACSMIAGQLKGQEICRLLPAFASVAPDFNFFDDPFSRMSEYLDEKGNKMVMEIISSAEKNKRIWFGCMIAFLNPKYLSSEQIKTLLEWMSSDVLRFNPLLYQKIEECSSLGKLEVHFTT